MLPNWLKLPRVLNCFFLFCSWANICYFYVNAHDFIALLQCRCCWLPYTPVRLGVLCRCEKLLTHGTHNVGLWKIHLNATAAWRTVRDLHISCINKFGLCEKNKQFAKANYSFLGWTKNHKSQATAINTFHNIFFNVMCFYCFMVILNLYQPCITFYLTKIKNIHIFSGLSCLIQNHGILTYSTIKLL